MTGRCLSRGRTQRQLHHDPGRHPATARTTAWLLPEKAKVGRDGQLLCEVIHWWCHIKHILAADVKHIMAPQQQYARGAHCASGGQMGVGLGYYAEPTQGGLVCVTLPIGLQSVEP
jgi:hypothetical protein